MAAIKRKLVGGKTYYYLEHSFRKNGKTVTIEKYLGVRLPKELDSLKEELISEARKQNWFGLFDKIMKGYAAEQRLIPASARIKETETFAVRFTYDTQRMEGSTLTLRETADLLERGVTPEGRPLRDVKEAEAHQKVFYEMLEHKGELSLNIILGWHRQLFSSTKPDMAGKVRQHQVRISGSKFVPPAPFEVYPRLTEFFKWYERNKLRLHSVELAALVHLRLVTIHPFSDGNGRISRLAMNFVLYKRGFPMLDIPYSKRNSYYNALERSHMSGKDAPFVNWFFGRYLKENRSYIRD
ncbi:Fic family protein [Candidatus Micrarchaeota archaeon]|nr:Fic family protein [Candidatus Micrarchaeota archaeon]